MINFDEEVLKFRPCLEIDETEDEIYRNEQKDLQDIIDSVVMSAQNTEYTEQQDKTEDSHMICPMTKGQIDILP